MMWARRPRRIHEGVMEILLDVIHDLVDVPGGIAGMQTAAGSHFDYCLVGPRADGRFHISTKQRNDAILIRLGYALYASRRSRSTAHDSQVATPLFTRR
jgi:hypothetical protein